MNVCTSTLYTAAAVTLAICTACAKDPASPSGGNPQLTAPAIDAPADDEQLNSLRPTLVVRNGTSSSSGARTYEFQISTASNFTTVAVTRSGIAENASGKTSCSSAAKTALRRVSRFGTCG